MKTKPNSTGLQTKRKISGSGSKAKRNRSNWEDDPGEDDYFSDKDLQDLMCLQVLTDYQLTKDGELEYIGDAANGSDDGDISGEILEGNREISDNLEPPTGKKEGKLTKRKRKIEETLLPPAKTEQMVIGKPSSPGTSTWTVIDLDEMDVEDEPSASKPTKKGNAKKKKKEKKQKEDVRETSAEGPLVSSPTFNLEAWSKLGVGEKILKALAEASFDNPMPIQSLTLGASILGKKDIVGAAETGSGKTLAFAIPILEGILQDQVNGESGGEGSHLQALILTPTRELAMQIKRHIDTVSRYTGINVVVVVGGLAPQKQERLLRTKPEVVIATIGRFWEMVQNGNFYFANLNQIRYLAIDETDRMVEKGHFQELEGILKVINNNSEDQAKRQNFVFSATLAFTHEPPARLWKKGGKTEKKVSPQEKLNEIMGLVGVREKAVKVVDLTTGKGTCETLVEMSLTCELSQKDVHLYYFLLSHPGRTIVFANSINCVRRLVNLFFLLGTEPMALHSEMVQKQRLRSLERFSANEKGLLIATDVAARGLDIKDIEHVIHYQVPRTAESYIHRSGRTARAFKGGLALVLIEPAEMSNFWNISHSLGRQEVLPTFPVDGELLRDLKARVNLAVKVEKFEHQVRKTSADINWVEKTRKEMDLVSSDEDSDRDGKRRVKKDMKKAKVDLQRWKEELASLIASNTELIHKTQRISQSYRKIPIPSSTKPI